ncbi:DNL zinc finger [Aspergillus sclerotialis]|uniref:DNL zinc finger n=1 Tax=Aspergillus sclerotialis TaxID=2070753 RepID=A0A3A2Z8G7_9EURO|nr:DNL zinc finger [Aspergillus sclerotialis]
MSKHGYHRGTVVIRCPSCKNRHVMSDHLKIFFDKSSTLDEILGERGGKVTRGYLDGDMEFWEDGTVTKAQGSECK